MASHQHPKANAEARHPDRPFFVSSIPKYQKIIADKGLVGLANDARWNELITAIRNMPRDKWCPSFRYKLIDSSYASEWDCEWWHHLPFPFISVLWLELNFTEVVHRGVLLTPEIIDHSDYVDKLLSSIGLDYEKGDEVFRIFGYAPRDRQGLLINKQAEQVTAPDR